MNDVRARALSGERLAPGKIGSDLNGILGKGISQISSTDPKHMFENPCPTATSEGGESLITSSDRRKQGHS